jgi:hypothetical protein
MSDERTGAVDLAFTGRALQRLTPDVKIEEPPVR